MSFMKMNAARKRVLEAERDTKRAQKMRALQTTSVVEARRSAIDPEDSASAPSDIDFASLARPNRLQRSLMPPKRLIYHEFPTMASNNPGYDKTLSSRAAASAATAIALDDDAPPPEPSTRPLPNAIFDQVYLCEQLQ